MPAAAGEIIFPEMENINPVRGAVKLVVKTVIQQYLWIQTVFIDDQRLKKS